MDTGIKKLNLFVMNRSKTRYRKQALFFFIYFIHGDRDSK
jgi:hypothetical protein